MYVHPNMMVVDVGVPAENGAPDLFAQHASPSATFA